ncbi:hypothetical protein OKA04_05675 [Luteolibacter flavescens]|uniref:Uncharacterized protein n=1 Tax=Luteolibacter flavescens TaxID=1859460 RepID=A0ABT3FLT9_9BACT|nr:hypothetical protein [Luteolibacter flavescens]MCW1884211.1 hypothetical protein [Luteolibacter flavescens]
MPCRIDQAVVRGEIDNTVEGKTAGWLWLAGREEPVTLDLAGDCWRDLAGTRLTFRNPAPELLHHCLTLNALQRGVVGDMTASRRTKAPAIPDDEAHALRQAGKEIPYCWQNSLYLEWFSEADGRMLIESSTFELHLSDHVWTMDADAEDAQRLANLHAMRDSMALLIRRVDAPMAGDDEFIWEERLKESERLTDAFIQVREKYGDDPDAQQKEAFAMGWDGLLDALAREDEAPLAGEDDDRPWLEAPENEEDDEPWNPDALFIKHPLQERAQEMVLRGIDLTRAGGDHPAAETLNRTLMQVAGKMAGALNGGEYARETGFVLALLKRCLNWQNDALAACSELIAATDDHDHERAMEALRDSIFELREAIVNLRKELKEN